MPDIAFATLDLVPDWAKDIAKEVEGKFVIKVAPEAKVNEFRDTNIRVSQERDDLRNRLTRLTPLVGEDPDAFATELQMLREVQQQVKDGKLKPGTDVQAEVDRRVQAMREGLERQNQTLAQQLAEANGRAESENAKWRRSLIDRAVTDAVLDPSSGAETSALKDILARAYGVFSIGADGKIVAKDGDAIIYGADGATPMSPKEYLAKLREQAPYFFKSSSGGGATGSQSGRVTSIGGFTREEFLKLPAAKRMELAAKAGITKI